MITVAKDGTGDYTSIQEAIDSIKSIPETIFIKKGTYEELVDIRLNNITLIGESKDETIITYGLYANMIMEDGIKRGTFRTSTFTIIADNFNAYNITFINSSGFGAEVGQALAVYAEGDRITFKNCKMYGHQDTLFTGPLPMKEKEPGGFRGPTEFAKRIPGHQLYEDCYIEGEIDFIFGSAIAYFKNCELYALNRNKEINAFYTAPSTYEGQKYGYVFENCRLTGNCPDRSVCLSRPWRIHAKTVFLRCYMSSQITDYGFHDWNKPESHDTCYYGEYKCFGEGSDTSARPGYVHQLTDEEALQYTQDKVIGF